MNVLQENPQAISFIKLVTKLAESANTVFRFLKIKSEVNLNIPYEYSIQTEYSKQGQQIRRLILSDGKFR